MAFFRHLLPVLAGAAAGCAATLFAQRYLAGAEHEHIVGSEAFSDAAEPVTDAAPAPAEDTQPQPGRPAGVYRPVSTPNDETPNPNPVRDLGEKAPLVDGKIDVEHIASPEDFANWDDLGCQG